MYAAPNFGGLNEIDILAKIINFGVHDIPWLKLMRNISSKRVTVVILLY